MSTQSSLATVHENGPGSPGRLLPGDWVTIEQSRRLKETGVVDDLSDDGRIVWVHLDHGRGRRMYLEDDGYRFSLRSVRS
jgi:hypothetical protein